MRITYEIKGETKQERERKVMTSFSIETQHNTREAAINLSDYEYIIEW